MLAKFVGRLQSGQAAIAYVCGAAALVVVVGALLILFSGANVGPGYVGVVQNLSGIDANQQPLTQGFHPVMPFVTNIHAVSIQPQSYTFKEVGAASSELQNVYVDGSVNFHVAPSSAAQLEIAGGTQYIIATVFDPAFQDYVKTIVPGYAAESIIIPANRDAIREAVKARLAPKAQPYGITVDDVFLTNIHFDADYTKAIEAKQVSAQQLEQAKNQAATAVQQAQGQAQANALLNASLTPNLIAYQQIQVELQEIAKWNGVMPQVVGSANPFVTLTAPAPTK